MILPSLTRTPDNSKLFQFLLQARVIWSRLYSYSPPAIRCFSSSFIYLFIHSFKLFIYLVFIYLFICLFFNLFISRYQVMLHCWKENPNDRPTFEGLRQELQGLGNQHRVNSRNTRQTNQKYIHQ